MVDKRRDCDKDRHNVTQGNVRQKLKHLNNCEHDPKIKVGKL